MALSFALSKDFNNNKNSFHEVKFNSVSREILKEMYDWVYENSDDSGYAYHHFEQCPDASFEGSYWFSDENYAIMFALKWGFNTMKGTYQC